MAYFFTKALVLCPNKFSMSVYRLHKRYVPLTCSFQTAFIWGSSKQGAKRRASVGSICVTAAYLQVSCSVKRMFMDSL